ncbi:MAG: glycosyltransferase family 2 protein [Bryobacteraceae bacterium]|jgi:glycosyltransferase involved in cell wall biosynthesis
MPATVLILTLNEERNLPACLQSVSWSDDVVVFDSFSSDRTVRIAEAFGARVFQRRFDNELMQRTASLQVDFKHPWVFNPDADELTPPDLRDEILEVTADPLSSEVGYRVRRQDMFMGRWIKHSSLYPTWVLRLFRPRAVRFARTTNLTASLAGPEGRLRNHLIHHSFNNGLEAWIAKHNRYSSFEALETVKSLETAKISLRDLFCADPVSRRRALKDLSVRLPMRPTLRFLYMYLARGGFLDGLPGYRYSRLLSIYEYMTVLKVREIHNPAWRPDSGTPIRPQIETEKS